MQKSYIFASTVNFEKQDGHPFHTLSGDTGIYDASTGQMTVYRGGELQCSLTIPPATITSMCTLKWMRDESIPAPAPVAPVSQDNEGEEVIYDDIDIRGMNMEVAPVLTQAQVDAPDTPAYLEEEVIYASPESQAAAEAIPAELRETTEIISDNGEVVSSEIDGNDDDVEVIPMEAEPEAVQKKKPGPKKKG